MGGGAGSRRDLGLFRYRGLRQRGARDEGRWYGRKRREEDRINKMQKRKQGEREGVRDVGRGGLGRAWRNRATKTVDQSNGDATERTGGTGQDGGRTGEESTVRRITRKMTYP